MWSRAVINSKVFFLDSFFFFIYLFFFLIKKKKTKKRVVNVGIDMQTSTEHAPPSLIVINVLLALSILQKEVHFDVFIKIQS